MDQPVNVHQNEKSISPESTVKVTFDRLETFWNISNVRNQHSREIQMESVQLAVIVCSILKLWI